MQAVEADVLSKKAALARIQLHNEKIRQDMQAAEAERINFEGIRSNLVMLCDETGCLFKKTRKATWNNLRCTEVIWEVVERVSCILRFPDSGGAGDRSHVAVFLRTAASRTTGDLPCCVCRKGMYYAPARVELLFLCVAMMIHAEHMQVMCNHLQRISSLTSCWSPVSVWVRQTAGAA